MTDNTRATSRNWPAVARAFVVATMGQSVIEAGLALWGGLAAGPAHHPTGSSM